MTCYCSPDIDAPCMCDIPEQTGRMTITALSNNIPVSQWPDCKKPVPEFVVPKGFRWAQNPNTPSAPCELVSVASVSGGGAGTMPIDLPPSVIGGNARTFIERYKPLLVLAAALGGLYLLTKD